MPDHLHLLVGSEQEADLIDLVKRFKQKAGWWFRNVYKGGLKASLTGLLRQRSYYDHIVRSDTGLRAAAEYVIGNPVSAGLTTSIGEYRFAGSFVWPDLNHQSEVTQCP
jgi:REP element-mobilizing transposase RayT